MARRRGLFDDLMSIGLKLPWKVALAAAAVIFVVLHFVAIYTRAPLSTNTLADMGAVVQRGFIHVFAEFFQYIIPAGLLIGTTVGYFKQRQSGALFTVARANPKPAITSMSWRDFERLVGEVFRRQGFTVSGFGGQGPDGGVDLGLTKNGQRFLVQCKHWRKRQVGVTVVRELNGVVAAHGAHGGFVVTSGEFTQEARDFAPPRLGLALFERNLPYGRGNGSKNVSFKIRKASRARAPDTRSVEERPGGRPWAAAKGEARSAE
jgi:restriction system protein